MSESIPPLEIGSFALLEIVAIDRIGAFLDWGQPKDLFLPFSEQTRTLKVGQKVLVYLYLDKEQRPIASMRVERNTEADTSTLKEGQAVQLQIASQTDIGFKAIINGRYLGVLYADEVFQPLHYGQIIGGFVKKVRPDRKVDLTLDDPAKTGHRAAEGIDAQILEKLKAAEGGFLPINDKTPAEEIYELFGVSKKKYKIALGGLYKQRLISIHEEGIRIVKKTEALAGLKILVVDDSADNQFLIGRLLKKRGADVDVADNGQDGVKKALEGEFSIILMDLQMPEMDGYTATSKLRALGFARPVIALTAHALPEVKEQCLTAGYDDHVVKPIDTSVLVEKILHWTSK